MSRVLAVALLLLTTPAGAGEVDRVVDRVVAAYGGAEAVAGLTGYRVEGRLEAHVRGQTGTTVRRIAAPDRFRVELDYGDHSELRILAGERGWRGQAGRLVDAQGPLLDSMISHLLRSDLPGALVRHRGRLEDRGLVEVEGRPRRLLVLPWSDTLSVSYWLDPDSLLVVRAEGQLSSPAMVIAFQTRYSDFRAVAGVLVAHHEESWAGPSHVATTIIERVVVEEQDPTWFAPPPIEGGSTGG